MFDPFESDSLFKRKELGQRKVLLWIFVPLLVCVVCSGFAVYWAWYAWERSTVHPQCACRRILKENPLLEQQQPLFTVL